MNKYIYPEICNIILLQSRIANQYIEASYFKEQISNKTQIPKTIERNNII